MRTALYLGLLYLGDAIRAAFSAEPLPDGAGAFLMVILFLFLVMDVADFITSKES